MFNEDNLVELLKSLGYEARRIPEVPKAKRPDVIAEAEGKTLLVELKDKIDDQKFLQAIQRAIENGGTHHDARIMGTHRKWGTIITHGVGQLVAHPDQARSIKLICVLCSGTDPRDQLDHLVQSLYGIRAITHDQSPQQPGSGGGPLSAVFGETIATCCYYFAPSLFAQHRQTLAGVIAQAGGEWHLLVNSVSPDYKALKSSKLFTEVDRLGWTIIDPKNPATIDVDDFVITPRKEAETDTSALRRLARKYKLNNPRVWRLTRYRIIGGY